MVSAFNFQVSSLRSRFPISALVFCQPRQSLSAKSFVASFRPLSQTFASFRNFTRPSTRHRSALKNRVYTRACYERNPNQQQPGRRRLPGSCLSGASASPRLSAHLHGSNADCLKSRDHMNDTQTQQRFVHLRAEGWSFARIAAEINVSKPTLINSSRKFRRRHSTLETLFTPIRSRIGKLTVNKR